MKKKIIAVISVVLLIVIIAITTLFAVRYFKYGKNAADIDVSDIESMEISANYGYLSYTYTYEFNFDNNSVTCEKIAPYWEEDTKTYCIYFTDKDAEYFVKKANLYGFFSWEGSYINNNIDDGECVSIYVKFKDGSVQKTYCYADFPRNYDKMAKVFSKAFGKNIL